MRNNYLAPKAEKIVRRRLNNCFLERCDRNQSYSLRAFARSLSIDPTLVSRIMKGQRRLTNNMANRIADELNFSLLEILEVSESKKYIAGRKLSDSEFSVVSKWYFFALLELFYLDDFQSNEKWMGRRLDLSIVEVRAALATLTDLGFLTFKNSIWRISTKGSSWLNRSHTTQQRKNFQKQILKKATDSIDNVEFSSRENATLTIAASSKSIDRIKNKIEEFIADISCTLQEDKNCDEVYQMAVSFFPVTKNGERK